MKEFDAAMTECKIPFVAAAGGASAVKLAEYGSCGSQEMGSRLQAVVQHLFPTATAPVKHEAMAEGEEAEEETKPLDALAMLTGFGNDNNASSLHELAATSSDHDDSPPHSLSSPEDVSAVSAAADSETLEQKPFVIATGDANSDLQKHLLRLQEALTQQITGATREHSSGGDAKPGNKIDNLAEKLHASAIVPTSLAATLSSHQAAQQQQPAAAIAQQLLSLGPLGALAFQLAQQGAAAAAVAAANATPFSAAVHPTEQKPPVHSSPLPPQANGTTPSGYQQSPKRKRQRRNPVWPYFVVEEGVARCKQCAYSTRSVFSTNLKVHLRSHHRADYEKVIEAEDQLNLNALLLSGNQAVGGARGGENARKRSLPPMTSSILMTISKLATQNSALTAALASANGVAAPAPATNSGASEGAGSEAAANSQLNSALRQALASNSIQQQIASRLSQQQAANDPSGMMALTQAKLQQALQQQQEMKTEEQPLQEPLSTPSTPLPAPQPTNPGHDAILQQLVGLQQQLRNGSLGGMPSLPGTTPSPVGGGAFGMMGGPNDLPQPKRRRLRRHPVWMFFRDLEDRMVGCINCNFRTGSAFSTNLKMHLKAHHKDDYSKVLKLEDDMRIEEGVFGQPNKIKTELIDFIRGGGNASTAVNAADTGPRPSPLVQQFIQQTLAGKTPNSGQSGSPSPAPSTPPASGTPLLLHNNNNNIISGTNTEAAAKTGEEDAFSQMTMTERLAALVGLLPQASASNAPEDAAEEAAAHSAQSDLLVRLGLAPSNRQTPTVLPSSSSPSPQPQIQQPQAQPELSVSALNAFNGGSATSSSRCGSDAKSCASSSSGASSSDTVAERRAERDRAVAAVLAEHGGHLALSSSFKVVDGAAAAMERREESNNRREENESASPDLNSPLFTLFLSSLFGSPPDLMVPNPAGNSPRPASPACSTTSSSGADLEARVASARQRIHEAQLIADPTSRHRKIQAEKMKLKRLLETPEQRERRLAAMKQRYRREKGGSREAEEKPLLPPPQTLLLRGGQPRLSGEETPEERERRLEKLREYQKRRLAAETPEQRERRLEKLRVQQRERRLRAAANQELIRTLAPDYEMPDRAPGIENEAPDMDATASSAPADQTMEEEEGHHSELPLPTPSQMGCQSALEMLLRQQFAAAAHMQHD